ncbi:MAG: hypothetical protein IT259_20115 [Saprospiraceae bacterium]|nr:hypothetical protein [Saprospiraceae bacterium]
MKNAFLASMLMLLIVPMMEVGCQNTESAGAKPLDIEVSPATLKTAEWADFKYNEILAKAATGDFKAIQQFFEFHSIVDGSDALGHGVSCLELIPVAGDFQVARVIQTLKPNLRKLLSERLVLAQGRTKKTELQKPLQEWAPDVWAALNGKPLPVVPDSIAVGSGLNKGKEAVNGPAAPPADSTAAPAANPSQISPTVPAPPKDAAAPNKPAPPQPQPAQKPKQ